MSKAPASQRPRRSRKRTKVPAVRRLVRRAVGTTARMYARSDGTVAQPPPGVGPDSPADVPASGWRDVVRRTVTEMVADRITIIAAGVAFYWFLAVFPLLFAAIGLLDVVNASPTTADTLKDAIRQALPGDAATILTEAVTEAQGRASAGGVTALVVGIAIALWSASSGMASTQVGLDVAYDVPKDRTFVKKRLVGFALLLAALVLGGIGVTLLVFGEPVSGFIADHLPLGDSFGWLWTLARWGITLVAVTLLFAVFYWIGPNRQPPNWKWLSPGGLLATLLWLLASLGFSLYVSGFGGSYAETYGALAGVVVLILWLYLSALAVLVGAELNGELERQRALMADREERAARLSRSR
jgi:membrane protein